MKIGLIRHAMDSPQGGARQVALLARDLCHLGEDVTLYCHTYEKDACFPEVLEGVPVKAVRANGQSDGGRGSESGSILNPHEWLAHRAAGLFSSRRHVPVVWSYNDPSGWHVRGTPGIADLARRLFGWRDSLLVKRFSAITVLDNRIKRIAEGAFTTPARLVRSGVDAASIESAGSRVARRPSGASSVFQLLSVGILFPHRRFEDAIQAVSHLRDSGCECRYDIIGSDKYAPGYGDQLRQLVTDLSLHGVVNLRFQSVSDPELTKAYEGADALVFANDRQTWGLAPLEAMAKAVPVIVSRGAGVHEVLTDGENALLVDPGRPEQIVRAIRRLVESTDLRGRLGEAGRRLVLQRFTSRHYAVAMLELFRECVSEFQMRKA